MNTGTVGSVIYEMRESDKLAVICGNEEVTYKELWNKAMKISRILLDSGVKKGDRIVLDMGKSAEYVYMMMGVMLCGAIGVTLYNATPRQQKDDILLDCSPVLVVDEAQTYEWLNSKIASAISVEDLPDVKEEDPCWIAYTSGSTGKPKGSVICHQAILLVSAATKNNIKNRFIYENCERLFVDTSLSFIIANYLIWLAVCNAKTVVLATEEEASSVQLLAQCIKRNHVDHTAHPQSWIVRAMENPDYADAIRGMKMIEIGGEKNTDEAAFSLHEQMGDCVLFISCGSTETLLIEGHPWEMGNADAILNLIEGIEAHLLNEKGQPVEIGMSGEICYSGKVIALRQYYNSPELNSQKYELHPEYGRIFHSGDMGRMDAQGHIHFMGRMDGMIKIHGARIEPGYPERIISEFPGIREVVVVATGEVNREVLCAWYTLEEDAGEDINELELRHYLVERLPYYMIPVYYSRLDKMPLTGNGKLDRKKLKETEPLKRNNIIKENKNEYSDTVKLLCRIFAKVLHIPGKVTPNDNFFELGGDSLSGLELSYRMSKEGYSFEMKWLYAAQSPLLLSNFIEKTEGDNSERSPVDPDRMREETRLCIRNKLGTEVEEVHPVGVLVKENLKQSYPWMRFAFCAVKMRFTRSRWKEYMKQIARTHEALRSVFVEEGGQYFRAVLASCEPECFYVDLTHQSSDKEGWSLPQQHYFDSMTKLLLDEDIPVLGKVMFRAGCITISEDISIIILYYSHALLDLIGVENLLRDIVDGTACENDRALFEKHTLQLENGERREALSYWTSVCSDKQAFLPVKSPGDKVKIPKSRLRLTGDRKTRNIVESYCAGNGVSFAAFVHALLGRILCRMSKKSSTVFTSVCSGRGRDEFRLSGMFAVMVPFLFRKKDSFADVREQLIAIQNHAWLLDIPEINDEIAGFMKNAVRLDIIDDNNHEMGVHGYGVPRLQCELSIRELILLDELKKRNSKEDGKLTVYVNRSWPELFVIEFDTEVVDTAFAKMLQDELKREIEMIAKNASDITDISKAKKESPEPEYAASVMTPVHEVKLPLLKRAFSSLKRQKLGFENLEWIILLHNCSDEYKEEVHHLFDDYNNIVIEERNVPGTSLQYARSELLELASGKYVFFLDGDDEMTPTCLEKAIAALDESGADLATWAVIIRQGDHDMWFCCDANPFGGNLVLEKGDPRIGKTMCFSGPGLWAHAFRRSFLVENNIRFNADSEAGKTCQDVDFILDALLVAHRVLVMPDLTGYIYYYGIGMFNAAGTRVVSDMMSLAKRYNEFYRGEGLSADNLIWAAMSIGLIPQFYFVPESIKREYLHELKDCFLRFSPPQMNWHALQGLADNVYSELKRISEMEEDFVRKYNSLSAASTSLPAECESDSNGNFA